MVKSGLTHIDVGPELTRTEWESEESHAIINGNSFPGSPVERQLFYRNDLHEWYIYTGSAWASLQGAGGGLVVHDNAFHTPDFEEEGVAATQIEMHRTAAEHTQDQPSTFLKLSDTPAAFTGQAGKYPKVNVGESALEFGTPGGAGDMLKSVYDPNDDGVLALAQLDPLVCSEAEADAKVSAHAALATAVHGVGASTVESAAGAQTKVNTHAALTAAHSSTPTAASNRIVLRDASARAKFAAPAAAGDALIKGTAITDVEHGSRGSALHTDSHGQNTDKVIKDADSDTKIDVEEAADEDTIRMDVAGVEAFKLSSLGILSLPKQSGAQVHQAANQTIPTSLLVPVCHDTESFDNQNEFDSTVKIGAADATEAFKLHDADGGFAAADVGASIWNTTDGTYAIVTAFVDSGELTLDTNIMANGEGYKLFRSKFTVTEAGKYLCIAKVQYESIADQKIVASYVYRNGSIIATNVTNQSHATSGTCSVVAVGLASCSANDILQHRTKQWAGNPEDTYEGADGVFFQVIRVA